MPNQTDAQRARIFDRYLDPIEDQFTGRQDDSSIDEYDEVEAFEQQKEKEVI